MTIPNILTISRILCVPWIFYLFSIQSTWLLWVVAFMFLSDFVDGYLARALNQTSQLGSILDPVADKLIVLTFFPFFYSLNMVPLWFVLLVVTRDIAQLLSIPILNWVLKIQFKVNPSQIARWTTALNFIILSSLFLQLQHSNTLFNQQLKYTLTPIALGINALLEIYILVTYIPRFIQIVRGTHDTFE